MSRRRSLGWPITLGVVMIVLLLALLIGWIVLSIRYWSVLAVGATFLVLVLVGVILYLTIAVQQISLNRRQSNFIDSVTHELKSPIASLKLCLQTLGRRSVTEAQQADFYRFMLDDLDRLDMLINHLLDAARLDQLPLGQEARDVRLDLVLRNCAETVCHRHRLPPETVAVEAAPCLLRARPMDVEIVFRNLIDNAVKYSGPKAQVSVESWTNGRGTVTTRVSDNGPGIPAKLRRKIFGRFVRLGNELERATSGTGLGLYIVRTLVGRMRGKISVRGRAAQSGTVFEVELPGEAAESQVSENPAPVAANG
ncbi:MAG TPA: HAMP domain-containing sensor histidine kinase [Pirellulales bacterium]|nr:HAMP domain-containing sensor histidine kinase [Pirellulales bacterium]